ELSEAPNFTQSPGRGGGPSMARGLRPDSALGPYIKRLSCPHSRPLPGSAISTANLLRIKMRTLHHSHDLRKP
ncbi:MAG: hypothetical protein RH980_01235, partial [Roseovarius confluentis]